MAIYPAIIVEIAGCFSIECQLVAQKRFEPHRRIEFQNQSTATKDSVMYYFILNQEIQTFKGKQGDVSSKGATF